MAKNNFNFRAALKLESAQFKKGVADVKKSLASLKNSFMQFAGALGAGLGFTALIGNLKSTAMQLSVAKSTLKNVSKETKTYTDGVNEINVELSTYSDNLAFVKKLSEDYSQDLVSLTHNFAQFHAACENTNLSLEAQKDVFAALTKAAAYFHMSEDRAKDTMTAITQMMSKGKVASEELRRQLGNSLPGAFNIMAAAVGVSSAELEKMMSNGEVLAAEVLPKFAAMLNQITKNADFNSLQLSVNKLKNAWYSLVENSGAESMFDTIVKKVTNLVEIINRNINGIKSTILSLLVTIANYKLFSPLVKRGEEFMNTTKAQIASVERELKMSGIRVRAMAMKQIDKGVLGLDTESDGFIIKQGDFSDSAKRAMYDYNKLLVERKTLEMELAGTTSKEGRKLKQQVDLIEEYNKSLNVTEVETEGVTTATKAWKNATVGIRVILKSIKSTILSMGIVGLISLVIGALTKLGSAIAQRHKELKEIRSMYSNYLKERAAIDTNNEAVAKRLNSNLGILKDNSKKDFEKQAALDEINKEIGLNGELAFTLNDIANGYDKITNAVDGYIKSLVLVSKIQMASQRAAEAEEHIREIDAEKAALEKDYKAYGNAEFFKNGVYAWGKGLKVKDEMKMLEERRAAEQKILDQATADMKGYYEEKAKLSKADKKDNSSTATATEKSDLNKLYENYLKAIKEYNSQLKEGAITTAEYERAMAQTNTKFWADAAATGEMSIKNILAKVDKKVVLSAMEKWYKGLKEAAEKAAMETLLDDMVKDAVEEIGEAIEKFGDELAESLSDEMEKEEKKLQLDASISDFSPKMGTRDTTFDYKKSKSDIRGEELSLVKSYLDSVTSKYDNLLQKSTELGVITPAVIKELEKMAAAMRDAQVNANTLEEAMKLAQIQEDIKSLSEEIGKAAYGGLKNFASSMDRIVKGAEQLGKTLSDADASGWDKFIAIINQITQYADAAIEIMETLKTLSTLSQQLSGAKEAETAQTERLNKALGEEYAWKSGLLALDKASTVAGKQAEAQNLKEAASSQVAASANSGEAIAGATKSGAKLPFPYNLLAIAAGVAAVVGALSMMSKFEKGGIVGGNSTHGDHNTVRANSGEMILTKGQQGTLWAMLNGKGSVGGNVQFKIKVKDLVGTINNYHQQQKG